MIYGFATNDLHDPLVHLHAVGDVVPDHLFGKFIDLNQQVRRLSLKVESVGRDRYPGPAESGVGQQVVLPQFIALRVDQIPDGELHGRAVASIW